jgi:F-type H+-transporting ATPase subunit alpha
LDDATKSKLDRGERTVEILKQGLHETMPFELQALSIFALTKGHLDQVKIPDVKRFEQELHQFFQTDKEAKVLLKEIQETKDLKKPEDLNKAMERFTQDFI